MLLSKSRLEMIEASGRFCQLIGIPRSTGQIYGLLYLSPMPLSLDRIVEFLGISKASASIGTRQLTSWGAIRQVWILGDRRDHYEVEVDLANLLRTGYLTVIKPRLASSHQRLNRMSASLDQELAEGVLTREEHKLCAERLKNFERIQKKLNSLAPLAEKLI